MRRQRNVRLAARKRQARDPVDAYLDAADREARNEAAVAAS